jgi:hypothetical protein
MSNSKICSDCNKTFLRPSQLIAHKNKKKPCIGYDSKACIYCDKKFTTQSNMARHLKDNVCLKENERHYIEKNEAKLKNIEENLLKEKQEMDEKYKNMDEKYKHIEETLKVITEQKVINNNVNSHNNIVNNNNNNNNNNTLNNNTVILLTKEYIKEHFTGDPYLQALPDYDAIRQGNMITDPHYDDENIMFVNTILSQYERGKLVKYLGNILLLFYKNKDDISKQSLWCSDLSRMTFLVRILPTDSPKNMWVSDPACVNVKEKIIKPLLNYIIKCIDEYRIKYNYKMKTEVDKFLTFSNIVKIILNDELTNDVAKYIAPHFTLSPKVIKDKTTAKTITKK